MTTAIEVEVTPAVESMLSELEEQHGEEVISADLTNAVQQAARRGYQQIPDE